MIGSDKIRVQLYTRWCIWTQLYLCTIWCIICTAYGPYFKPKHVGPIVYLYGPNYTDLPSYGAYGVHIMDLTLCQNMWVQFYTRWCLWTQLHYVSYGVFEPNFKPKNVGPNMHHKMWLQLYTIWCVGPTSYQIGAYVWAFSGERDYKVAAHCQLCFQSSGGNIYL